MAKAAIVIVCMNNLKNLFPCLDSIKQQTKISYEVWVVAYLFSKENLNLLREKYPWVIVVESNEIRVFSENNNLALRQVKTEYTLVLNDDTLFKEPVLDELVKSMEKTPDAKVMSPKLVNADGSYQSCGKNPVNWYYFLREDSFGLNNNMRKTKYINKTGIFQTYNISGACFLIKTEFFRNEGFFDEYYFFCPEDIALSTKINEEGGKCYVDSTITLYHLCGGTRKSAVKTATLPAQRMGCVHFHGRNSLFLRVFMRLWIIATSFGKFMIFSLKKDDIEKKAQLHSALVMFTCKTPKEIFTKYYLQLKKNS